MTPVSEALHLLFSPKSVPSNYEADKLLPTPALPSKTLEVENEWAKVTEKKITAASTFSLKDKGHSPNMVFTSLTTLAANDTWGLPFLNLHVERLLENAIALFGTTLWKATQVTAITQQAAARHLNRQNRSFIRIIHHPQDLELVLMATEKPWCSPQGIDALSYQGQRPHPLLKTEMTTLSEKATHWAQQHGADVAILVDAEGKVLEAAWSNVFWIDAQYGLCTTKGQLLPGIMRKVILEKENAQQRTILLKTMLETAQEVFVTNSAYGIQAIRSLDGKQFHGDAQTRIIAERLNTYALENLTVLPC